MKILNRNLTIFLTILTLGCSKNKLTKTNPVQITTYQKLLGKWRLYYEYSHKDTNGTTVIADTNYYGLAGDYFEFKENDTVYIKIQGTISKSYFELINDDTILIPNIKRKIELLNDTTLLWSFGHSKDGIYDFSYFDYLEKW